MSGGEEEMKVAIVIDHPLMSRGMVAVLRQQDNIQVVGEAEHREEALSLLTDKKPDVVIIDSQFGMKSCFDIIEEARFQALNCKFVILSSTNVITDFERAKGLGVAGYMSKLVLPEEILHALAMIQRGRTYYDPVLLEEMMAPKIHFNMSNMTETLTPKEMEVLMELGKGHSNRQIANALYITEYTVKKHVSQVLGKLNLTDRTQAALYANAAGLVKYVVN